MKITDETKNIAFADAYIEGDLLYAVGLEQNMMLEYNMKNSKSRLLRWLDENIVPKGGYGNSNAIFRYGESLFCFFMHFYGVAEFNLKQRQFEYYCPANYPKEQICAACRVGNEVWMFPKGEDKFVVVFSTKTKEYTRHKLDIEGKIDRHVALDSENSIYVDGRIWRCIPGSSDLLCIDTEKKSGYVLKLGLQMQFQTMVYDKGFFYILSIDGRHIVVFHVASGELNIYETGYSGIREFPFIEVIRNENYFLCLPCFEQKIVHYEIKGKELQSAKYLKMPNEFKKIHDIEHRSLFLKWKKEKDKLLLLPFGGNGLLSIDLNTLDISYQAIALPDKIFLERILQICPVYIESEIELKDYIEVAGYGSEMNPVGNDKNLNRKAQFIWNTVKS